MTDKITKKVLLKDVSTGVYLYPETGLEIPTKLSELTNDSGFITSSAVKDGTLTIQKNGVAVGTFTANSSTNKTINITVPTSAADIGAVPTSSKFATSLSVSIDPDTFVITSQLFDQDGDSLGEAQTIDLPLESVVVSGSYDKTNKKIVLTLQSGSTVDVPVGDLISGLQTQITSTNKLSADLIADGTTNKVVTASEKTTWNGKQNKLTAGTGISISGNTISNAFTSLDSYTTFSSDALAGDQSFVYKSTTGDYLRGNFTNFVNSLIKPTFAAKADLSAVATSGSYADLTNKPTIPSKTSDLTNDSGFITSVPVASSTVSGTVKVGTGLTITNGILSADAQKIDVDTALSTSSVNPVQNKVVTTALNGKQATIADLATIRSNASAGKTASDTIATYGDIVSHNTSEFAKAAHTHAIADVTNLQSTLDAKALKTDLANYIPKIFGSASIPHSSTAPTSLVKYGNPNVNGYLTSVNVMQLGVDKFFRCYERGATITCNYDNVVANLGKTFCNGSVSGHYPAINPSTAFASKPFVWEVTSNTVFEVSDVSRLQIFGHRLADPVNCTAYKIEVYAYNDSLQEKEWVTVIDYSGSAVNIAQTGYGMYKPGHTASNSYYSIFGVRLTISGCVDTVFRIAEIVFLANRGTEQPYQALHCVPDFGGTITGNLTVTGTINGTASKATADASGNTITTTYATKTELGTKQDTISDLATIRSNASTGAGLSTQVNTNKTDIANIKTNMNNYLPLAGGTITGDILPNLDNKVSLGSDAMRFKEIYAHELKLSTNSLYLGDTKILGTDANTINIKADAGQSLALKSQGSGVTNVQSFTGVAIETIAENGTNPDGSTIKLKALGDGSSISMIAPTIGITGATTVSNLTVTGNLNVGGTTTTISSQNLEVKDNIIEINKGETGTGVSKGTAGLKIDRGEKTDYFVVYDETDSKLKIGVGEENVEPVATETYVTNATSGKLDATGTAASAAKLTTNAGNATKPVYFANGVPVATTYELNKTVPADAKFTDTTYTGANGVTVSGTTISNSGVRSISAGTTNGTIKVNTNGTSTDVAVKGLGSAAYTNSNAYATASHTHAASDVTGLAKVATSGSYADLSNKPTIPTTTATVTSGSTAALTSGGAYTALAAKANTADLSTVAKTGSYADLTNKPTIPAAVTETTVSGWGFTKNAGTVTSVKINGTTKNPTSGVIDLGTVLTAHQDISGKQDIISAGSAIDIKENTVAVKLYNPSEFVVIGSPTITEDGIAGGFTTDNYLRKDGMLSTTKASSIVIEIEYIHQSDTYTETGYVFDYITSGGNYNGSMVRTQTKKFAFVNCIAGSATITDVDVAPIVGQAYRLKIETDNNTYFRGYVDGIKLVDLTYSASSVLPTSGNILLGVSSGATMPLKMGKINLKHFSVNINGVEACTGVESIYEALNNKLDKTAVASYVKKAGDTMTGALNFANNAWNKVGDDAYIGDRNVGGHVCIKPGTAAYDNSGGIQFFNTSDTALVQLNASSGALTSSGSLGVTNNKVKMQYNSTTEALDFVFA